MDSTDKIEMMRRKQCELLEMLVNTAVASYEAKFNALNAKDRIFLKLSLDVIPSNEEEFIKKASLRLIVKTGGVTSILFNKVFAFRTIEELKNESDWKFKMYCGLFEELSFSGLSFILMNNKE